MFPMAVNYIFQYINGVISACYVNWLQQENYSHCRCTARSKLWQYLHCCCGMTNTIEQILMLHWGCLVFFLLQAKMLINCNHYFTFHDCLTTSPKAQLTYSYHCMLSSSGNLTNSTQQAHYLSCKLTESSEQAHSVSHLVGSLSVLNMRFPWVSMWAPSELAVSSNSSQGTNFTQPQLMEQFKWQLQKPQLESD